MGWTDANVVKKKVSRTLLRVNMTGGYSGLSLKS